MTTAVLEVELQAVVDLLLQPPFLFKVREDQNWGKNMNSDSDFQLKIGFESADRVPKKISVNGSQGFPIVIGSLGTSQSSGNEILQKVTLRSSIFKNPIQICKMKEKNIN